MRILVVGVPDPTHVGGHFMLAAKQLGHEVRLLAITDAYGGPRLVRALYWHLLKRRPPRLDQFSRQFSQVCCDWKPDLVVTTGLCPLDAQALRKVKEKGIKMVNFLTDDPWNKAHFSPWFFKGLPTYQHIFTPRHANEPELNALNGPRIHYLPFAYAPEAHFPPDEPGLAEMADASNAILFIGGADDERAEIMADLKSRGMALRLWGSYWDSRPEFRECSHGHAGLETFRREVASNAMNLCLVRRANRDGHSMRTFEIPAVGGCMLVEDTEDHRHLFGADDETVRFFSSMDQLEAQARSLLGNPATRRRLAHAAHYRICSQLQHTYAARLQSIIETVNP